VRLIKLLKFGVLIVTAAVLGGCSALRLPDMPPTALPAEGNGLLVSRILLV
jgi:hypothetical protein